MVTPRFHPDTGGIQTHVKEVGERLADLGVDVEVLTTDVRRDLAREEVIGSLKVLRVPAWPRGKDYYFAPEVWGVVTTRRWDLIHCQGVHTFVAPIAMAAAHHARTPYIVTFHTGGHSTWVRHQARRLQWHLLRPLLSRACGLIAVSRFEADLFRSVIRPRADQLVTIPNGVVPLRPGNSKPDTGRPTILSIGRLEKYKGHHRLIAAMPEVLKRLPQARAVILGTGKFEKELRHQVRRLAIDEHVEIRHVPAGSPDAISDEIAASKLVVLFSDYEAHPVSLLEAASVGRPILVSKTSGLTELVDAGLASGIPPGASPVTMADAIVRLLGRASRTDEPSALLPTWSDTAESTLEQYERCLARVR